MANEAVNEQEAVNYLEMSDEDMDKLELPAEPINITVGDDPETSSANADTNIGDDDERKQTSGSNNEKPDRENAPGDSDNGQTESGTASIESTGNEAGSTSPSTRDETTGSKASGTTNTQSGGNFEGKVEIPDESSVSKVAGKTTSDSKGEQSSSESNASGSKSGEKQSSSGDSGESGQASSVEGQNTEVETLSNEDAYKQIMEPFKANGRQMEVKSVEEVRRLMQMGANYNSKMAGLKPNLKILKMLENNDILDETKLSFLIDISKKDPAAITQLIKDSGINVLDMDLKKDSGYKSKAYTVSDNEVDLAQILEDVNLTDTGKRTIDILSNKWDEASKEALVKSPDIITVINEQMANGIYDQVIAEIDRARILGQFTGISDIDAYKQMGNHMQVNGMFKGQVKNPVTETKTETTDTLVQPKAKVDDLQLKKRKQAASATTGSNGNKKKLTHLDILDMPDEEFNKLSEPV